MSLVVDELLAKAEDTLQRVWGFGNFRPLQQEAVLCALQKRDSVVVLPTGGGKSLCFQVPALCQPGLAIVVSPLISLMKDQVDALQANGVAAAFVNSTQRPDEQRDIANRMRDGQLKLVYVAPERLLTDRMLEFLSGLNVSMFAIDEAHCISDWGHDFRPEYRGLRVLKERFQGVPVHAYTATAPEHVRRDIAVQLGLVDPEFLVGSFDRPNLVYRMLPRDEMMKQVVEVLNRHRGQSGIIYCITRKEVESIAGALNALGVKTVAYHAGMDDGSRKANQDAFIRDEAEVVVATVAFGMGIDKPDVRFVVHAGMPKSIENYQQESGRAGRDGLESECVLIYSGQELARWRSMFDELEPNARQAAERSLQSMHRVCSNNTCRHRALSAYFGQELGQPNCGACDVCLGEITQVDDPITLGQKILSCVLRLDQRFGADYTAKVLVGSSDARVLQLGHDRLSTYGLLKSEALSTVRGWIEQLVAQQFLVREGEYQTLKVTASGARLLKREVTPQLSLPPKRKSQMPRTQAEAASMVGVDTGLMEHLRQWRLGESQRRGVPAYVLFGDNTLRELARIRPSTIDNLQLVKGIGEQKLREIGQTILDQMDSYCREHPQLQRDLLPSARELPGQPAGDQPELILSPSIGAGALASFAFFRSGLSLDEVCAKMDRARSTVSGYLAEFIRADKITDPARWVSSDNIALIESVIHLSEDRRLKPIYDALEGKVPYDDIRIVVSCYEQCAGLGALRLRRGTSTPRRSWAAPGLRALRSPSTVWNVQRAMRPRCSERWRVQLRRRVAPAQSVATSTWKRDMRPRFSERWRVQLRGCAATFWHGGGCRPGWQSRRRASDRPGGHGRPCRRGPSNRAIAVRACRYRCRENDR